jgi:hypothetical protein
MRVARIRSFRETQLREGAFEARARGLQPVALERIVGSVSRWRDFDQRFRPRRDLPRERLVRVRLAVREGRPLPPVELYQVREEFFVLDGHHRVAAARERGYRTIEARVTELLPAFLARVRRSFQALTDLPEAIELTGEEQYAALLDRIRGHQGLLADAGRVVSLAEAAADWQRSGGAYSSG